MGNSTELCVLAMAVVFAATFAPLFTPGQMFRLTVPERTINDTLSTKLLQSIPNKVEFPKIVTNLYQTLTHFIKDNCLIVVNNFEGVDIYPSIEFPLIFRQFELAEGNRKGKAGVLGRHNSWIWIPRNMVARRNGNISVVWPKHYTDYEGYDSCSHFVYMFSLWPADPQSSHCLGPNSFNFVLSSRPWKCEVQVDLFMPEKLFREQTPTQIFDKLSENSPKILPSLRPPVNILVDTKANVEDFDWLSLAAWTARQHSKPKYRTEIKNIQNQVQIIAHLACESFGSDKIKTQVDCNIQKLNVLYMCPGCRHFINKYPLSPDHLSFEQIAEIEKSQKYVPFVGSLEMFSPSEIFHLAGRIAYIAKKQNQKLIRSPLQNLHKLGFRNSDKLEMLAFGYASLYTVFMGNITFEKLEHPRIASLFDFYNHIKRIASIQGTEQEEHDTVLQVSNDFGRLHFVSCGSRGIEPFPFIKFVAVYKWQVWVFILISVILPSVTIGRLYTVGKAKFVGLYSRIISMYKILVEQGNPFPENFDKIRQMRFLMSGTLLAGVVISNAFKSENVYNIVLPRSPISYYNLEELIEDNVTVYSRIQTVQYALNYFIRCNEHSADVDQTGFRFCKSSGLRLDGRTELYNFKREEALKIRNYSKLHPEELNALLGPIQYLDDFLRVGILKTYSKASIMLIRGSVLKDRFQKLQENLIERDLLNCSKSAWVLPNYLAQILKRMLKRAGKHSDVSGNSFTSPFIGFSYEEAYVTSSILQQISWMPQTGLLEWWPKFVNRSDVVFGTETSVHVKPDMSGNILVIFVILGGGLFIAIVCMILEFWRGIILSTKVVSELCVSNFQSWANKCRNSFSRTIVTSYDDETALSIRVPSISTIIGA